MKSYFFLFSMCCIFQLAFSQGSATDDYAYYCPPCNSDCDLIAFEEDGTCNHCGMRLLKQSPAQHEMALKVREMTIGFYLQDGVEVLDFAGPLEVFSYAGFEVVTISKNRDPITSQGVLKVIPDYSIKDAPKLDILATFGGNSAVSFDDQELILWTQKQEVDYYFSVCTGAFLFSRAGILDGLKSTTFHSAIDRLQEENPKTEVLRGVRYVDNGRVITTAGISAGIDGALHLVSKLLGPTAAERIAENMEYDKWVPDEGYIVHKP